MTTPDPLRAALDILDVIDGIVDDTHPEGDGCPLCAALDDLRDALAPDPTIREACGGPADGEPGRCHGHFRRAASGECEHRLTTPCLTDTDRPEWCRVHLSRIADTVPAALSPEWHAELALVEAESRNATLDEVVRVVEGLPRDRGDDDWDTVPRQAALDAVKALQSPERQ